MADKRLLGNIALPEYSRLVYNLDSEGPGIHIENKDDHRIFSVKVDSETIVINSEGFLYLPIDNVTIYYDDSEHVLKAAGLDVKPGEAVYLQDSEENGLVVKYVNVKYDSETILLNSENALYVPLDYETIIINSEGKVALPIDRKTIFIDSEDGLLKAAGLVVSEGLGIKIENSEIDGVAQAIIHARFDSETIILNSEGDLTVPIDRRTIIINSEGKVVVPIDERTIFVDSETGLLKAAGLTVSEGEAIRIETSEVNGVEQAIINVRYDDITIHLNSENQLEIRPDEKRAIAVDSEGKIFIMVDDRTVKINSEGKLFIIPEPLHDGVATHIVFGTSEWDSEAINVLFNSEMGIDVDSENRLFIKVDNHTVRFNSEGQLEAQTIKEGIANHIFESEGDLVIDVLFDDITIHLNSENKLELHLDEEKAIDVDSEGKLFIKVDGLTIQFNSEGQLIAFPEPLHDGIATHIVYGTSEWDSEAINVLFNSEMGLDVDSENRLFVKADLISVFFNSEGQLEVRPDNDRAVEITSEGKFAVKVDNITVRFDSEGRLHAIPEPLVDGIATHVFYNSEDSESVNVLFNEEAGLRVNSENELEVVLGSEGLVFNSEGAIELVFDHRTIVFTEDSEGKVALRVPIDEETIRINSEGKLSADSLPKPLINSTFLHVSSEGEVEWRPQRLNEVELIDDLNTETARIIWYGTSEEYDQLVANSEIYDYTLYVINDATPIVSPDKNYNKLDNKPEINGVVLSGNKSLSDFGIQPVLHSGVATNLNNNKVDVQFLAGVLGVDTSNRLYADTYTTAQIDNMLASLRTIRYEATKPAVPVRNTLYYVGTSSPYHMWLYDSYGTEIDLGTSDVRTYSAGPGISINSSNVISADLDTIINVGSTSVKAPTSAAVAAYAETKDNKVTSISAASTNEEYPSAKLLYDQLQTKIGAVAASDTSLQILGGTTLTHATPANLGGADTKGTSKKIPQITYDKFGHLQKVEEKDLEVPLSSGDTSLMLNASNELTHVIPANLGAGSTVGGQTVIPQITYDKFGHLQKVTGINVYPPTTSGLNGQLWVSDGVEAGAWTALSQLVKVKPETGTSTTSGSTTIVVNAPAADAGFVRVACIGAYISSTVDNVCWSVPSMTDSQVTFYANGWTGSATITAYTQWLYVRSNG